MRTNDLKMVSEPPSETSSVSYTPPRIGIVSNFVQCSSPKDEINYVFYFHSVSV
jgi:hypothetical protein